ncbi:MAG TPA: C1 family peptidase [Kofleriaceae bacterium]
MLAACAQQPTGTDSPANDDPYSPGLSKYEHVFNHVPDNSQLPDIGKADAVYPTKSTELLASQSPVKDQDRRGVCTIFTTTSLMESLYIKAGMPMPSFSEQYLQWSVKVQLGSLPNSEGSNISNNVDAVHQFGIVEESVDPYNGKQWTAANDADCAPDGSETQQLPAKCWTQGDPTDEMKAAKKYTLPAGKFINTKDIKAHITSDKTAVALGIDFFYQAWNHGASTLPIDRAEMRKGIVRYPNATDITESHKERAGHGILIVGWDDAMEVPNVGADGKPVLGADGKPTTQKGFYIFKNSWGTEVFGVTNPNGAGYGYISEKYIEKYATAYVTKIPALDSQPAGPPPPATCSYLQCSDYGFAAGECRAGLRCDDNDQCLDYDDTCN